MAAENAYRPDPLFAGLGAAFADPVAPALFPQSRLRWRNRRWGRRIGLGALDEAAFAAHFHRFEALPGNMTAPLAMRYHGHQFRTYNPDLGDGRGFLFAQLRDGDERLLDLATKGSGQTPYSRFGDGRLTLKGAVREILAAEMLEAQGVYTSKAFAVFETGEALQRTDEPSPTRSAVLTRLGHSHIRIGTFQRHAFHDRPDLVSRLVDHCAEAYYPDLLALDGAERAAGLLAHVTVATAALAASWMSAGFVHGVLNTDNMNVTGESFDYGPWRFLPRSDPNFTAAYFDHNGFYCFGRQPQAAAWNCTQLAGALVGVCPQPRLEESLLLFAPAYQSALRDRTFARLGLAAGVLADDLAFLGELFRWMTDSEVSWPQFFHDWFAGAASEARAMAGPERARYGEADFAATKAGLMAREPVRPERLAHAIFQAPHPPTLLIEDVEAIWTPIAERDDWSAFDAAVAAISGLRDALDLPQIWASTLPDA
jgi:uncharacterized protein YdiU (UPF0061 family)